LDRAFKDAAKITQEDRSGHEYQEAISERLFSRCLEINDYQRKDSRWFLSDDIEDTVFNGYGHPERREYLFFTVANDKEFLRACLTDTQVITKRLESKYHDFVEQIESLSTEIEQLEKDLKSEEEAEAERRISRIALRARRESSRYSLDKAIEKRDDLSSKLELIQNSKFAIVFTPEVTELQTKVIKQYSDMDKGTLSLPLYVGDMSSIQIGDLNIPFKAPTL
jgi:hypothetical protein